MPHRRRHTVHRVHHRRHRRAHRAVSRFGAPKSLWGLMGAVIPAIAFAEQITSKDRNSYPNGSMMQRGQSFANNVTGNMFGFNLFKGNNVKSDFKQQINPSGIVNKYTGIGVASLIGAMVLKRTGVKVPMMNKVFSVGKKMIVPGVLGGFFDDVPPASGTTYNQTYQNFAEPSSSNNQASYDYVSVLN